MGERALIQSFCALDRSGRPQQWRAPAPYFKVIGCFFERARD